jgi:hypothetical protein
VGEGLGVEEHRVYARLPKGWGLRLKIYDLGFKVGVEEHRVCARLPKVWGLLFTV